MEQEYDSQQEGDSLSRGERPTLSGASIRDMSVDDIHLKRGATFIIEKYIKPFQEAIMMLSRLSDYLVFHLSDESVRLIAINATSTAFARVTFPRDFFEHFNVPNDLLEGDNDRQCRVELKCMTHLFKVGRSISQIRMELDPFEDYAVFHVRQVTEVDICYVMNLQEFSLSNTNVFDDRNRLRNKVAMQAKHLTKHLAGLDGTDVSFIVAPDSFVIQRHLSEEEQRKSRKTEVSIAVDRFDIYHVHSPSSFVVSLHHLRSILIFAEHCGGMGVFVHFDRPQKPIIVVVEENVDYGVEMILGTRDLGDGEVELEDEEHQLTDQEILRTTHFGDATVNFVNDPTGQEISRAHFGDAGAVVVEENVNYRVETILETREKTRGISCLERLDEQYEQQHVEQEFLKMREEQDEQQLVEHELSKMREEQDEQQLVDQELSKMREEQDEHQLLDQEFSERREEQDEHQLLDQEFSERREEQDEQQHVEHELSKMREEQDEQQLVEQEFLERREEQDEQQHVEQEFLERSDEQDEQQLVEQENQEVERFQRWWLSLSTETLDEEEWLAQKRVLCYESDDQEE